MTVSASKPSSVSQFALERFRLPVRAHFLYNPAAGQTNLERELSRCLDSLSANGWDATLTTTERPCHATELAASAAAQGVDLVVAVGGDGTVSEVASGLAGTDTIMGVIPAGTTNVWALQMGIPSIPPWHPRKVVDRVLADLEDLGWKRPLGIPSWLSDAFQVLLQSDVRAVDTGLIGGRSFLMWCGIGFDATVTEAVVPEDKRRYGIFAYIAAALSTVVEYNGARMRLDMPGRQIEDEMLLVVGSNMRLYGGVVRMAPSAYLDDGLLDVLMFKGEGMASLVRHVTAALAGRHTEEANVEYLQTDFLSISSLPSQPVHADSENCGTTPVDIAVRPRSLRVLTPATTGQELFIYPPLGRLRDFV